jgi:hypothetical protein
LEHLLSLTEGGTWVGGSWSNAANKTASGTASGSITKAQIQAAAKALADMDVSPLKLSIVAHPTLYWANKLALAKDAGERRTLRKRKRRAHRYWKIGQRKTLCHPRPSIYFCASCGSTLDTQPTEPCPCKITGIQQTMDFEKRGKTYADPNDFITFDDLPTDILKTEYIDEAVQQIGEDIAKNFGKSVAALVN